MRRARILIPALIILAACFPYPPGSSGEPQLARVERRTKSAALDRITKREAMLDGMERHRGDGRGVTVYVFDGGIDTMNAELRGRVRVGFNAFADGASICNPHGTAVASAIAGKTVGVAFHATIVDVKVIDCRNWRGTVAGLIAATQWVIADHARRGGPAVANWSLLVDTSDVRAIDIAVARLREAGILVVAAAGNVERDACQMSPAGSRHALVVGASSLVTDATGQHRDQRTKGTAWGDCVDLYAPGDSVLLAGPGRRTALFWTGTSMAAGFVSGAAAIVLERDPLASPDSVAAVLRQTATQSAVEERHTATWRSLLYIGF